MRLKVCMGKAGGRGGRQADSQVGGYGPCLWLVILSLKATCSWGWGGSVPFSDSSVVS